jgi:Xaa-Pro aminopeptidase
VKRDIDRLMQERKIDAAVVTGPVKGNATMYYMVNGAALSHALVLKRRGEEAVLLCGSMEREEAALSGLRVVDTAKYDHQKLLKAAGGDRLKASVVYYRTVFEEFGISGRTAFYGQVAPGASWVLLREIEKAIPDLTIVGEFMNDLLLTARETKGPEEIERIEKVATITKEIVKATTDFMRSHRRKGKTFVKDDGTPLSISDCKAFIRVAMAERNVIEEVGTIFSIGRDAGIPHSRGNDRDPIELGKTIIFDIFPQEQAGGYFFDFTRTYVLGEASPDIARAYRELEECYDTVAAKLKTGERASVYQTLTCDFFEKLGHETPRTNPQVTNGYVHSLGHGIGLEIHEKPTLSDFAGNEDVLAPGSVFTFEPGLYYPDKGFGLRIEDVYRVTDDGKIVNMTNYPRELVLDV